MGIRTKLPSLVAVILWVAFLARCGESTSAEGATRIAYGPGPSRFGELWLPAQANGPLPVVVLVHGGCWQSSYGRDLMDPLAKDLSGRGFAVWNIEYRRLGEAGGGYPGTFNDVAQAFDALSALAQRYPLNLAKIIAIGHSAGGHLALWAAARSRLPADSPLKGTDPLRVSAVVTLAGINDLAAYRQRGPACGGAGTIDRLVGAPARVVSKALADTSPRALLPLGVPQLIVSGTQDGIVPAHFGRDYVAAARVAGDQAEPMDLPGADHFALIDPASPAWRALLPAIQALAR